MPPAGYGTAFRRERDPKTAEYPIFYLLSDNIIAKQKEGVAVIVAGDFNMCFEHSMLLKEAASDEDHIGVFSDSRSTI
ncbi:hypothetical protein NDU88_005880 [Pleurodeles waltl]|uniref:Endonuclease/exonuclease/phosphatase domain-containing protein n=1 Tax=Pleurodeles waltl TaxID=8319 RepID=A0AAV7RLI2_PLEWA|nr:hypothetical protein NDU88_005880 [Pleurodeles waltl]